MISWQVGTVCTCVCVCVCVYEGVFVSVWGSRCVGVWDTRKQADQFWGQDTTYITYMLYIHTWIHTYINTYIHTQIHKYIHTFTHTYIITYCYIHKHNQQKSAFGTIWSASTNFGNVYVLENHSFMKKFVKFLRLSIYSAKLFIITRKPNLISLNIKSDKTKIHLFSDRKV